MNAPQSDAVPPQRPARTARPARNPRPGHRTDIDGLRGLAIALVVVFHVFIGRVSAGVDVFLLLGGIFFFAPQIRNALNPKGLTVIQSFLRILRRLFPALITVVLVSVVAAAAIFGRVRWVEVAEDATASLLYRQNLHLADLGQDYSALNRDVSVFQHIWSMSVQMQIYLGSLLVIALIGGIALLARGGRDEGERAKRAVSVGLHWLLVVATVASFIYAAWLGSEDQGANYYSPISRFWEIGLGGLFGIWLLGRTLPRVWEVLRWPAGVLGVCLIIATGIFLDGADQFPGPLTLIPLVGAMLVVLSGNPVEDDRSPRSEGVTALLETRPFQFLGRIAYSLYLWHWPLLVLVTYLLSDATAGSTAGGAEDGSESAAGGADAAGALGGITATLGTGQGILAGTGVVVVSCLLGWATYRFIETPLRQGRKPQRSWVLTPSYVRNSVSSGGGFKVGATAVVVVASVAVLAFGPIADRTGEDALTEATDVDREDYPGPRAFLADAPVPEGVDPEPNPDLGEDEMIPDTQTDGCFSGFAEANLILTQQFNSSDEPCEYGDVDSDRVMYLAGGSHSEHYLNGLDEIGRQEGIRIVPLLKMGCVLGMELPHLSGEPYPECSEWQQTAEQYILDNPPTDGVFMTVTRPTTIEGNGPDVVPQEYVDQVARFSDAGIHTWGMRDTPWHMSGPGQQGNARLCVAAGFDGDCGGAEADSLSPENPALQAYEGLDITNLDINRALCRDGRCPAIVGNVLVYRDGQHFTSLFSSMLGEEIHRQMFEAPAEDPAADPAGAPAGE
ncbi:MAG TPA: acyltransferase [Candidatus Corynebacterium avicola]|uniref:Acyltransferase n=1 Tax=Candidatus Corynebacterium avicola TaxID=2838527 RepID=A0A9D1UJL1_9CORY|nr:acyltransferase [Candidatus Corynebacterium avicola]